MKTLLVSASVIVVFLSLTTSVEAQKQTGTTPLPAAASNPREERWLFHMVRFGEEFASARVSFSKDGKQLTGTLNELTLKGTIDGDTISFVATRPNGSEFGTFVGKRVDGVWRGRMTNPGGTVDWVMRAMPPLAPPQLRSVAPTRYHRTFSASAPPLLHINPGDTIRTTTIDSAGYDGKGERVSFGGNPQTGPFYVNGAVPGDTIAVTIRSLAPNRATARSGTQIVPVALTPDGHRAAKYDDGFSGDWTLDLAAGVATLAKPTGALKDYRVPIRPFLGGIGVAPDNKQAIDARALGAWGGNLDYREIGAGTTIYLPVFEDGALLFLGDGHAAQGDGELTGDALETSMDVEFSVALLPGKTMGLRAENADAIMAMGVAGSLHDALRLATTQLSDWLQADYGLSANEAAIILGTALRYDIAEVVDPQFHIVARVAKASLPQRPAK